MQTLPPNLPVFTVAAYAKSKENQAMSNPVLGHIECDACDQVADIKQRANGNRLFYLHCKQCGMDNRSGAKLQAKWKAATQAKNPGLNPGPKANFASETPETDTTAEWQPDPELEGNHNELTTTNTSESERTAPEDSDSGSGVGRALAVIFVIGLAAVGIRAKLPGVA